MFLVFKTDLDLKRKGKLGICRAVSCIVLPFKSSAESIRRFFVIFQKAHKGLLVLFLPLDHIGPDGVGDLMRRI